MPEYVWKRPRVNMAIWKDRRGGGGGEKGGMTEEERSGIRGEEGGLEERREGDVMCTTAALWRVGLTLSQRTSGAQIRGPLIAVFKFTRPWSRWSQMSGGVYKACFIFSFLFDSSPSEC